MVKNITNVRLVNMMICKECKKKCDKGDKFCGGCGSVFKEKEEQASENQHSTEQEKANKKRVARILALALTFIAIMSVLTFLSVGSNPIREMNAQLVELDSASYNDIKGWVEYEFPELQEALEEFDLTINAYYTDGEFSQEGFLHSDSRFVSWDFDLDEYRLELTLTYLTKVEYGEYIIEQLTEQLIKLDSRSFSEITKWIEENEEDRGLDIRVLAKSTGGDTFYDLDVNIGEEFFVEWDFEFRIFSRIVEVNIDFIFEVRRAFTLGETFEFAGIEFTFSEEIIGGRVDSYGSRNDGQAYFAIPVVMENISEEVISISRFGMYQFYPNGLEMDRFNPRPADHIALIRDMQPGTTDEGYLCFRYIGEGEYVLEISHPIWNTPFEVEVIIPVYDIDIPEEIDPYNRDVPIPSVVYDLHPIHLFDHTLPPNSFFYSIPYVSEQGNTHMILEGGEVVRDPEGVITHDSLRLGYVFFEIDEDMFEDGFDAVQLMENVAWNLQQGGSRAVIMGEIHATTDRTTAFLHVRGRGGTEWLTRLVVIQLLPSGDEYVIFETWLWTIRETSLEGERREAIEEFGRLTGIDFIGILAETYEGSD